MLGQILMIIFAAVLAFAPSLYILAFIGYFVVLASMMFIMQRRIGKGSVNKVLSGRILLKEEKAMDIALRDEELNQELAGQAKVFASSIASLFIVLGLFSFATMFKPQIVEYLHSSLGNVHVAQFVYWLSLYELLFIFSRIISRIFTRGVDMHQFPVMPPRYVVTDRGIAAPGVLSGFAIEFPFPEEYEVVLHEKRWFVEIRTGEKGRKIRLYTKNPRRLYELITKLNEKMRKSTQTTKKT